MRLYILNWHLEISKITVIVTMENVPPVISVSEGEHMSLTPDQLAFTMSEDENGLNYAYIIHLPVDAMHVHEPLLADSVPEQDDFTGDETKHTPSIFPDQVQTEISRGATILLPSVGDNSCDTIADMVSLSEVSSMTPIPSGTPPDFLDNLSVNESRPIEIQYLESGIFLHEGQKCEIENLNVDTKDIPTNESDDSVVKFKPVTLVKSTDHVSDYGTFSELNDQENVPSELVEIKKEESLPCDTPDISGSTGTDKIETPKTAEPELIDDSNVRTGDFTPPKRPVRTYGKLKSDTALPITTTASLKDTSNATVSPSETRAAINFEKIAHQLQPDSIKENECNVISVSAVKVIPSQRITIRPRKRRLIIDAQKQIPIPEFKRQLLNTKDIVHERIEIAPGTRKAMKCLESGGVAQFFSSPGRPIVNVHLCRLFNNHLVMIADADSGSTEFKNVEPLNADLRIPNSTENEVCDLNSFTGNGKQTTHPMKRLINVGKQQVCYFKGLRKPPVFKEYKRIRNLSAPNGTRNTIQCKKKLTSNINSEFISASMSSSSQDSTVKVEEVVYTVEDGESVVLKSHAIIEADYVQNCDADNNLVLKTSVSEETDVEEIKNQNHCSDTALIVNDTVDVSETKVDTEQFPTGSVDVNFCNGNTNFEVQNMDHKLSVDLQIEDDLNKMWNYEISSS